MEDAQIIDLYWQRNEDAIQETDQKYGNYCNRVAYNILGDHEDGKECVNSTYWKAWNAMPPHRPRVLIAFLGKITRNLALNIFEKRSAQKRGCGQVFLALEELEECIPDPTAENYSVENADLAKIFNSFLAGLPDEKRKIFVSRYWGMSSVNEIAFMYDMTEGKVKTVLRRTREQLKRYLEQEGISV